MTPAFPEPPELRSWQVAAFVGAFAIVGDVYGHPRRPDGERIVSSIVADFDGRLVRTRSGSLYRLGDPSPQYRAYLAEHHPDWDPKHPIALKGIPS